MLSAVLGKFRRVCGKKRRKPVYAAVNQEKFKILMFYAKKDTLTVVLQDNRVFLFAVGSNTPPPPHG
jgi:hypothetical protein